MQFSIAYCIFLCLPKIDYGMYKVLLQNTFQSSMPLLNAFFGLPLREHVKKDLYNVATWLLIIFKRLS